MNKINSGTVGGFPLAIDDLAFIEDNSADGLSDVVEGLTDEFTSPVQLNGVILSITNPGGGSPVLNTSSGAIYYLNEVFSVDDATLSLPAGTTLQDVLDNYEWDLVETTNTPVVYKNGTTNDAYVSRKAKVVALSSTWPGVKVGSMESIRELLTPSASETTAGLVRLTSDTDLEGGSTSPEAVQPNNFNFVRDLTIQPFTGSNSYTQVSNVTGRYKRTGKLVYATAKFTLTANSGGNTFNDFEIQTNIEYPFSDLEFGGDGTFHYTSGFRFNSRVGSAEDWAITARVTSGTTVAFGRGDGTTWNNGDSVDVYYSGVYVKS